MAYELSKTLDYKEINVQTPLGIKHTTTVAEPVVLCSILRAGLALHQGFMNFLMMQKMALFRLTDIIIIMMINLIF